MKDKGFFIVDVCGTLFKSNTTFDFMAYYFGSEKWYLRLNKLRRNKAIIIINRIIVKVFHFDFIRFFLIQHLMGYSKEQLGLMVANFYDNYLSKRINEPVLNIIEEKRNEGYHLVIVSATLDIIADYVARIFDIELQISSELSFGKDYICRGKLKSDLLANKSKYMKLYDIYEPYGGIVTDNDSDMDLVAKSRDAYFVVYNGYKQHELKNITGEDVNIVHL